MKFTFAFAVSLLLSGACFAQDSQTIWTVDDDGQDYPNADFDTIQAAVNAASDGDEIRVYSGTYTGSPQEQNVVNMLGKSLRLIGDPNAIPTIDGQGTHRGITCENGETEKTIIEGFTITNGNAMFGGGMLIAECDTTLLNCTFANNFGSSGGGLCVNGGAATISNCTFTGNTGGVYAGGMSCIENGTVDLMDCTFTNNTALFLSGGVANSGGEQSFVNCAFIGNDGGNAGGGMFNENNTLTMTNCSFTGNLASGLGGGGMYNENSTSTITNCSFTNNTSKDSVGGGMLVQGNLNQHTSLTNCTFSGNYGSSGGGITTYSSTTITDCEFFDNSVASSGKSIRASEAFFFGTNSAEGIFGSRLIFGAESLNEVTDYITWPEDNGGISFDINDLNTTASLESPSTIHLRGSLGILNDSQSLLDITGEGLIIPLIQGSSLEGSFNSAIMPLMPEGLGLQLISPNTSRESEAVAVEVIEVEGMQFADPFSGDLDSPPLDMASFDADGDGRDEVAILFDSVPRSIAGFAVSGDAPPSLIDGFTATVGNNSVDLDVGDLNGDGLDDLLVANGADQTMSVLLTIEKSDGLTFGVQHISFNGPVTSVAVINWDGDEALDAVVGLSSPAGYQVILDVASQFSSGPWLAIPDYDIDPDPNAEDYVSDPPTCVDGGDQISSWGFVGGTQYGRIHRAIPDGSLQVVAELGEAAAGQNVLTIQALELDDDGGDGQIDLMALSREAQAGYLFQGDESEDGFGSPVPLAIAEDMTDALILDPDLDGDMDILLAVSDSNTPLILLRNDGVQEANGIRGGGGVEGRTWSKETVDAVTEATRLASGSLSPKDEEDDWVTGGGSGSSAFRGETIGVIEQTSIVFGSTCSEDLNEDGIVGVEDLLILIAQWGTCSGCSADFDSDDIVGVEDLLIVIAAWGSCK